MAAIIDGRALAQSLHDEVAAGTAALKASHGITPCLAVILVGTDPASEIYVSRKLAAARAVAIQSREYKLNKDIDAASLLALVTSLNRDPAVHGILVQLPLPTHVDAGRLLDAITPEKDVDGFHPVNVGRLSTGGDALVPCTPLGCMMLLDTVISEYRGLKAVVIGKSNIVGKPVAMLLLERECTVCVTHIHTRDLTSIVRTADIVIVAAGHPGLVRQDWIKPGAVVIDVGINRVEMPGGRKKIVGDVAFDEMDHAAAITPVPGGVGPMTVACLLSNTLRAAQNATLRPLKPRDVQAANVGPPALAAALLFSGGRQRQQTTCNCRVNAENTL